MHLFPKVNRIHVVFERKCFISRMGGKTRRAPVSEVNRMQVVLQQIYHVNCAGEMLERGMSTKNV